MGAWGHRSSSSYDTPVVVPPNPDPNNYRIVKHLQIGKMLILKVNYPGCVTFEGNKILVFKDVDPIDLLNQKVLDPHFFQNDKIASPIARFRPSDEGWKLAVQFAHMVNDDQNKTTA